MKRRHIPGRLMPWLFSGLAAITLFMMPVFPVLTASGSDGKAVWTKPVQTGDLIVLRYTHSVARTNVDERLRVQGNRLVIESSVFESFGAGLPSEPTGEERLHASGGKLVLEGINRPIRQLDVRIGRVIAGHRLLIKDDVIELDRFAAPGSALRLEVRRMALFDYLTGRVRKYGSSCDGN